MIGVQITFGSPENHQVLPLVIMECQDAAGSKNELLGKGLAYPYRASNDLVSDQLRSQQAIQLSKERSRAAEFRIGLHPEMGYLCKAPELV